MIKKIKGIVANSSLQSKIRYSYLIIAFPLLVFVVFFFFMFWNTNKRYDAMINSAVAAGEFSLDFKKDFDYETYLLVVENKTIEESELNSMINEAKGVVEELKKVTDNSENLSRLESVNKYLDNLEIYKGRIEDNLIEGDKYNENIDIWENDVQIVTSLIRESILQYIYTEITELQTARDANQKMYTSLITISGIAFIVIVIVTMAVSLSISRSISSPVKELNRVTNQVAKGDLSVRANISVSDEIGELGESMNIMIDKINELLDQVTSEQIRLRKAEFELLQSQINPHFLYNTLDTIVWLAEAGDQKMVVSMVENLSDFFRISLSKGKEIISLKDEIQHVRSYLEIQSVRYRDILTYEIDINEELENLMIPKITLQPIVENALYHGIKNKRGMGKIVIRANRKDNNLLVTVSDNGIGMDEAQLSQLQDSINSPTEEKKGGFGLYNVNERIKLTFGDKAGIKVDSVYKEGTTVEISLPIE